MQSKPSWRVVNGRVVQASKSLRRSGVYKWQIIIATVVGIGLFLTVGLTWALATLAGLVLVAGLDWLFSWLARRELSPEVIAVLVFSRTIVSLLAIIVALALLIPLIGYAAVGLVAGWGVGRLVGIFNQLRSGQTTVGQGS